VSSKPIKPNFKIQKLFVTLVNDALNSTPE